MRTAKIEHVAAGVFAAIADEGGVAVGNAGFVDIGGEMVVFDTHVSLTAARASRRAAEEHWPVSDVVLSHWHSDYVYGAAAFDARVVATKKTAELRHVPRACSRTAAGTRSAMPSSGSTRSAFSSRPISSSSARIPGWATATSTHGRAS